MLAVLSRYKLLLVIFLLVLMAVLAWILSAMQDGNKKYTKGVFVMEQTVEVCSQERGCADWSR